MNTQLLTDPYVIIILFFWELIWKGFALYRSAQDKKKVWFIAIFLLNTLGILPILFFVFRAYNLETKIKAFFGKFTSKLPKSKIKFPKFKLGKK